MAANSTNTPSNSANIPPNPAAPAVDDQTYWARIEDNISRLDERIHRIAISNVRTRTEMYNLKNAINDKKAHEKALENAQKGSAETPDAAEDDDQPKPVFAEIACYKEWLWTECEEEMKRIFVENAQLKAEVVGLRNENEALKEELKDIKKGGDTKKEKNNKEEAAGEPAGDKKKKKKKPLLDAEGKPILRVQIMTRHPPQTLDCVFVSIL
jgi:predicted RNase H-like nuclease (RuvC/YqgF family)